MDASVIFYDESSIKILTCHNFHSIRKFASPLYKLFTGNLYATTAVIQAATITVVDLCHAYSGVMDLQ